MQYCIKRSRNIFNKCPHSNAEKRTLKQLPVFIANRILVNYTHMAPVRVRVFDFPIPTEKAVGD